MDGEEEDGEEDEWMMTEEGAKKSCTNKMACRCMSKLEECPKDP